MSGDDRRSGALAPLMTLGPRTLATNLRNHETTHSRGLACYTSSAFVMTDYSAAGASIRFAL